MQSTSVSFDFQNQTIPEAFENAVTVHKKRIALSGSGVEGSEFTYDELLTRVISVSKLLSSPEYEEVEEVGLLSENRPEWPIAYLGVLKAGKTVVPVDANLKLYEIERLIEQASLKLVICSAVFEPQLMSLSSSVEIISMDDDLFSSGRGGESPLSPQTKEIEPDQTAVLIYTSGTTGKPKAVELTHSNLLSNVWGAEQALRFDENDIFLSLLPLHHTFEATCGFLTPILHGCKIVYARSLNSRDIVQDIRNNKVTIMCGVPLLYEKMYQSVNRAIKSAPFVRRVLFKSLFLLSLLGWKLGRKWGIPLFHSLRAKSGMDSIRMFVSGGAPIRKGIVKFFNIIGFCFIQGYGLTECSPILTVNRPEDISFDSVGQPLPNVEIKIDNPDREGVGEVIARGANITNGYRHNPVETKALIRGGWLYTGDLGKIRSGHLLITGRAKNLIVSAAGKNIYPEELEDILSESSLILESVVMGRKRNDGQGEDVEAVIVPDFNMISQSKGGNKETGDKKLVEMLISKEVEEINGRIASFKRITKFRIQYEEFEKTSTRKIKRSLVRVKQQ